MLREALAVYGRHFGTLVLTCAVALLPANLLAAGAVVFGLASLGSGGFAEAQTHSEQIQQKQQDLRDKPPASTEARDERTRQLGREAFEGGAAVDARHIFENLLPIAYATAIVAGLLLAGLFLAHAAAVPLVLGFVERKTAGPGHAWAVVASRLGALFGTGLLGAALVALGAVFFILPGVVLAAGFSLAPPLVILEGMSGRAALERSWRLLGGRWAHAFLFWALIVAFSVLGSAAAALLPAGPWRPAASTLIRVLLYPLPLTGLVLLYRDATQYMRRTSASG
ncbi:MAG: hypothetical protein E6J82_00970 [Deltaproteobacteria bacterium]|nr:MAG: hypothetical protein E6J82_00970 [Deltaproteobacteria bacterium]TMA76356.1 MAG: hypothetical protein E6J67_04900 [Deltaproteobacteria bacterium]TMB39347.1 MAG: hypothetical protein E6J58_07985 [Deltaproteobacteria bacterium]